MKNQWVRRNQNFAHHGLLPTLQKRKFLFTHILLSLRSFFLLRKSMITLEQSATYCNVPVSLIGRLIPIDRFNMTLEVLGQVSAKSVLVRQVKLTRVERHALTKSQFCYVQANARV